ncbi:MAG: hypothetical protein ACAH65_02395 [Chloroflexota bacterium]
MSKRGRFGALAGALLFTFAAASTALAAPKAYDLTVVKSADKTSLPVGGGTVVFTIAVTNTGTGAFHGVAVSDSKCSPVAFSSSSDGSDPGANGSDAFLQPGEWWKFTCSKTFTTSGTYTNTASASGCGDGSTEQCNQGAHADASATSNTVTITVAAAAAAPAPTVKATAPATSTTALVSGAGDGAWLAIIALGVLLASVVILTPRRKKSES